MVTVSPEKMRRLRRIAVNAGFGILVFIIALYVWFPYGRAKELAVSMAAVQDLDLEIGSAGPALGLGVTFKDIRVATRPTTGKPTRFTIDSARVTVSPFSLLSSSPTIDVTLDAFGGRIDYEQSGRPGSSSPSLSSPSSPSSSPKKPHPFSAELHVRDVDLKEVPGIKAALNLPMTGTLKLDLEIASATGRYAESTGAVSFTCATCVLGDGKSPLKVEGNPFLAGGLTLPRVRLGDFGGHVAIEKGAAKLQGVEAKSPDGEVALEGEVVLRDPLATSLVNAYLRFRFSDPFLKGAETVRTLLQMAAAPGKRADGSYGMRLAGTLSHMSPPVFSAVSPIAAAAGPPPRLGARPTITPSFTPPPPVPPPVPAVPQPPPPAPAAEPPPPPPPPPAPPPPQAVPPPTPEGPAAPTPAGVLRGLPPGSPPAAVVDEARRATAPAADGASFAPAQPSPTPEQPE